MIEVICVIVVSLGVAKALEVFVKKLDSFMNRKLKD